MTIQIYMTSSDNNEGYGYAAKQFAVHFNWNGIYGAEIFEASYPLTASALFDITVENTVQDTKGLVKIRVVDIEKSLIYPITDWKISRYPINTIR